MVSPSKKIFPTNGENREDRISNLPAVLTDKILELLPLYDAAKMSVLSKDWRNNWRCLNKLVFNEKFWNRQDRILMVKGGLNWEIYTSIVNNILTHHQGPIYEFCLEIHYYLGIGEENICYEATLYLNSWISFLSNNGVKKITLVNHSAIYPIPLPSHIYSCIELEELKFRGFDLMSLPTDFKGFKHIRKLVLISVISKGVILGSLIANCPKLTILKFSYYLNDQQSNVVIDAPNLEVLTLNVFSDGSIHFKNVSAIRFVHLKNVPKHTKCHLSLGKSFFNDRETAEFFDTIKHIASSCQLKSFHLSTLQSEVFAAIQKQKWFPWAFTHLNELRVGVLKLDDAAQFSFTFDVLRACSSINKLDISVGHKNKNVEAEHNYDYENSYKLGNNLVEVNLKDVSGSPGELKLIEYVVSASVVLEKLTIRFEAIDDSVDLKLRRLLNGCQRASPKAKIEIICRSDSYVV